MENKGQTTEDLWFVTGINKGTVWLWGGGVFVGFPLSEASINGNFHIQTFPLTSNDFSERDMELNTKFQLK